MSLKIGIVGAGVMLKYQAKGFLSAGAKITCLADINPATARNAAATYSIPATYANLNEMLVYAADQFDAVSILTPPVSHKTLTLQALAAGKHVFCEKPPALSKRGVKEMKAAAEIAKKHLLFDFNNRIRPESVEAINRVKSNFFGHINSAQATWVRRSGIPGFGSWFTNRRIAGGGALIDLLHMIDLALYFMGYPKPLYALGKSFMDFMNDPTRKGSYGTTDEYNANDVESAAHGLVTFESGQVLSFQCSWAEMIKEEQCFVSFQGVKAGCKITRLFNPPSSNEITGTCEIYSQSDGQPINESISVPFDSTMGRVAAAVNFIQTIEQKTEPLSTPFEAYRLMSIIDAIYLSAQKGEPVKID